MNTSPMTVTGDAVDIIMPQDTDKHAAVVFVALALCLQEYQGVRSGR